ncbi:MAG: 2-iminoacetate synthase ThiH, partial [Verrucomicrobiota bacterium]
TEPGGYTGEGSDDLHLTVRGRRVELDETNTPDEATCATGQFGTADERSAQEMARVIREKGMDPVWKDWDPALLNSTETVPIAS